METDDPDRLMTAEDVARLTQMTKGYIYQQVRDNAIPHIMMGRYVRFRRESILQWFKESEQHPRGHSHEH